MTVSQSPGDAPGQPPGKSIAGVFTLTAAFRPSFATRSARSTGRHCEETFRPSSDDAMVFAGTPTRQRRFTLFGSRMFAGTLPSPAGRGALPPPA